MGHKKQVMYIEQKTDGNASLQDRGPLARIIHEPEGESGHALCRVR